MQGMLPRTTVFRLISKGVWLELLRRQDLYVCGMIMCLFLVGVSVMRIVGIDSPAAGTFILNMGMTLAAISAHVLLLLLAVRQFPTELENRTLYPLLARPVRRADILWAKWLAIGGAGFLVYVLLALVAWLSIPKLETYDPALLAQLFLLQWLSLIWLAGVAIAFSLLLPRGLAVIAGGLCYFAGAAVRRLVVGQEDVSIIRRVLGAYIPDFGMLDLTTRYTDGIVALTGSEMIALVGYAAAMTFGFILAAVALFDRRRL